MSEDPSHLDLPKESGQAPLTPSAYGAEKGQWISDALGGNDKTATASSPDKTAQSNSAFDALERDFREVLNELVGDKSLERFRLEYEKLHTALRKSHENEKRMLKKCRELNAEIVANAAKVQSALRLSRSDQNNIILLKKEIDNAWKIVDAAQEKEKRAKETIQRLKGEIEKLSRIVDQGAGLSIGQETAVNELLKEKEALERKVEELSQSAQTESAALKELTDKLQQLELKKLEGDRAIHELREQNIKLKQKAEREARRAERLQTELMGLKEMADTRKTALSKRDEQYEELRQENAQLQMNKRETEFALEKYREVAEELRLKNQELERTVAFHVQRENALLLEKEQSDAEVQFKREELRKKTQQLQHQTKVTQRVEHDKEIMSSLRADAEKQRDAMKAELVNLQKELELQARNADADEKVLKELSTQIKRLAASLAAAKEKNNLQLVLVRNHEEMKKTLEQDVLRHKAEEERLRRRNYELEKEREKAAMTAGQIQQKFLESVEVGKMKELESAELSKKVSEERARLKMQQNLYEQVRADRNLFSKQHIQSQDEIAEMRRKFKIMTHQIEQLKEEILAKDHALINEHFAYKRLKDEMKVLKRKLAKREEVLTSADQVLASQDSEIKNLRRTLMEAESAQRQQKTVYDDVVQERDILGTQLIRRNDELALLYEKIRIQQSTLNKGEMQYRERLQEISLLKLRIEELQKDALTRAQEVNNTDVLKREVQLLQKELLQERTKGKALAEELENPMNVHRWRKLEGSDPERFELVQKVQTLQRRLIQKTEEVVERDLLVQEKERMYNELTAVLARQPGPEVAEQLTAYQLSLKEKTRQLKAMAAELNTLQAKANEYRFEIERLTREIADLKRKALENKRKDQAVKDQERAAHFENTPLFQQQQQFFTSQPKIAGGGFNLTATTTHTHGTAGLSVHAPASPASASGAGSSSPVGSAHARSTSPQVRLSSPQVAPNRAAPVPHNTGKAPGGRGRKLVSATGGASPPSNQQTASLSHTAQPAFSAPAEVEAAQASSDMQVEDFSSRPSTAAPASAAIIKVSVSASKLPIASVDAAALEPKAETLGEAMPAKTLPEVETVSADPSLSTEAV